MNKKTVSLTDKEYQSIIEAIKTGFVYQDQEGNDHKFRPNNRLSIILQLECNLGLRISDILNLHINDIVRDGKRYHLDIIEQKTGKKRDFTVPTEIYYFIRDYAEENNRDKNDLLFTTARGTRITERAIQKQLKIVTDYLKIENVSTHSFRKTFATDVYENSNYNIELVRELLQHTSVNTTQRYIGIGLKDRENALQGVATRHLVG